MFAVIENTPGYMPDEDIPPTFDTREDAVVYLYAEVDDMRDSGWALDSMADDYSWAVLHRVDVDYDLGRVLEVVEI